MICHLFAFILYQIPIWCSVLNEIVFEDVFPLVPPPWLSLSVISQINARLPYMVSSVSPSLRNMMIALLKPLLKYPLRPIWVAPDEDGVMEWLGEDSETFLDACHQSTDSCDGNGSVSGPKEHSVGAPWSLEFTPLVLLSCSPIRSQNMHSAHHSWTYIQGAGDDEENWSGGLTSELFWKHKDLILSSDDPKEVQ